MKEGGRWQEKISSFTSKLGRFRYPLLILLLGVILLLLPTHQSEATVEPEERIAPTDSAGEPDALAIEEERLSRLLSQVDGAGNVEVMLSIHSGVETIYQTDEQSSTLTGNDSESRLETTTVLYNSGSGTESVLVRQRAAPVYQGAIILCQGADDPAIKLALVQAVASLTGLGTDCITVIKMK